MRWLYCDAPSRQEAAEKAAVLARIDGWWTAFAAKAPDLDNLFRRRGQWDLRGWMHEHLRSIDERLMWEFGPGTTGDGHRLVITPETQRQLRPLVREILRRAPPLAGWEFYEYRLAEDMRAAEMAVQGRTGGTAKDLSFKAEIGEHNRIDLTFSAPAGQEAAVRSHAFVATECLLGEEVLDKWIGAIEIAAPVRRGLLRGFLRPEDAGPAAQDFLPIGQLRSSFDALVREITARLPASPLHTMDFNEEGSTHTWAAMKLEPPEREDYPRRSDLFVAITPLVGLWQAYTRQDLFHSCRYSRHGETFCYLKADGAEGLDGEKFGDRKHIENALNAAMVPAKAGCTVGGGTGHRYRYVDLALSDVPKAIEIARQVLRRGNVPKRTWLLFCDAELADEWVGIWEDTPAPPAEDRTQYQRH